MGPVNNPLAMMVQMMQSGRDPMQLVQQMAGSNPQMAQFMRMIQGKGAGDLQKMAENLARERGVSINDVARSLGLAQPSGK